MSKFKVGEKVRVKPKADLLKIDEHLRGMTGTVKSFHDSELDDYMFIDKYGKYLYSVELETKESRLFWECNIEKINND